MSHKEQHLSGQDFQGKWGGGHQPRGRGAQTYYLALWVKMKKKLDWACPLCPLIRQFIWLKIVLLLTLSELMFLTYFVLQTRGSEGGLWKPRKPAAAAHQRSTGGNGSRSPVCTPSTANLTQITGLRKGRQLKCQDQGCIHPPRMIRHPTTKYHRIHHLATHPWPSANSHAQPLNPTPGYFWKYEELGCLV